MRKREEEEVGRIIRGRKLGGRGRWGEAVKYGDKGGIL
jgi:hypothetical protein